MTSDSTRFQGKVTEFKSQRGFGYIERLEEGDDKCPKRVFVQWKEIKTDDRWPSLEAGMAVEFSVSKDQKGWKAENVTKPGGEKIHVDREKDLKIVAGTFKGTVKFFHMRRGFGHIELEGTVPDGVELKDKRVYVSRSEINTDDDPPALKEGMKVQFGIFQNDKGYGARLVSTSDGKKISYPPSARTAPSQSNNRGRRGRGMGMQRGQGGFSSMSPGGPGGWGRMNSWQQPWKRGREWPQPDFPSKRPRFGGQRGSVGSFGVRNRSRTPMSFDPKGAVEIGIFVKKWIVGGLVGKRGQIIRSMCTESGCKMQFGEDNIRFDNDDFRVLALSGLKDQVAKACKLVANRIGEAAQSLDRKLVFLVPEEYCGLLIGKKGSTINKIKGSTNEEKVRVDVSRQALQLPGANRVNMCTIYGGRKNVERAIDEIAEHLGFISQRIQAQAETSDFGNDGWGQERRRQPQAVWY